MAGKRVRVSIFSLFLTLLLLMTTAPVAADDPYMTVAHYVGLVPLAVAWQVEVPGEGCLIVEGTPSPITPKTCGGIRVGATSNGEVGFDVAEAVESIIVELAWEESIPGTRLQLDTMCADVPRGQTGEVLDPNHPCYAVTWGASSLAIRFDAEAWSKGAFDPVGSWAARVFGSTLAPEGGVGVVYEQTFDLYVSVFYGAPAPEDYSALP